MRREEITDEHMRNLFYSGAQVQKEPFFTYRKEEWDSWIAAHDAQVRADLIQEAIRKIEDKTRPTQSGRYAEVGYNDHFNDGLSEAVDVLEEMFDISAKEV